MTLLVVHLAVNKFRNSEKVLRWVPMNPFPLTNSRVKVLFKDYVEEQDLHFYPVLVIFLENRRLSVVLSIN